MTDRIERYEAYLRRGWRGKFTEAARIGLRSLIDERKRRSDDTTTRRDHEEPVLEDDAGDQEPEDTDTPAS